MSLRKFAGRGWKSPAECRNYLSGSLVLGGEMGLDLARCVERRLGIFPGIFSFPVTLLVRTVVRPPWQ